MRATVINPETGDNLSDEQRYFLHRISWGEMFNASENWWTAIPAVTLKNRLGDSYTSVRQSLVDLGMIEWDRAYRIGSDFLPGYCQHYRFTPEYHSRKWFDRTIRKRPLVKAIHQQRYKSTHPTTDLDRWLQSQIKKIRVAQTWHELGMTEGGPHERIWQVFQTENEQGKKPRFTRCGFGNRRHSALTVCKKEFRPYLEVDGEELIGLDVVASQPMFMITTLAELGRSNKLITLLGIDKKNTQERNNTIICFQKEIAHFQEILLNPGFYDYFEQNLGFSKPNRNATKLRFIRWLFNDGTFTFPNSEQKQNYTSRMDTLFHKRFAVSYALIQAIKRDDHRELARVLQRAESDFVYNRVCKRLMRENRQSGLFVATIHDSFICKTPDADYVHSVVMDEAEKANLPLQLKRDNSFSAN